MISISSITCHVLIAKRRRQQHTRNK